MQQQKEWTAKTRQQNDMTIRQICRGEKCAKKIAGLFEPLDAVTFVFPQLNSARAIHATQQQWTTTRKKLPRRIPQKVSKKTTHVLDVKWTMPNGGVDVNATAIEAAIAKLVQ